LLWESEDQYELFINSFEVTETFRADGEQQTAKEVNTALEKEFAVIRQYGV